SCVHQILTLLGCSSASIGTLGIDATCEIDKSFPDISGLTTADPIKFRKILQVLKDRSIDNVAFEASSHGIDQYRIGDVKVGTAAFVSFSQDHLDYHKNMDEYLHTKLVLFTRNLSQNGEAVINSEMMSVDYIKDFLDKNSISYSAVGKNGDVRIIRCDTSIDGQEIECEFDGKQYQFNTDIIGSFQATNILIAAKLVYNLNIDNIDFEKIINVLPKLRSVKGRLERVTNASHEYQIFIDYAHTPDALESSLLELQKVKKASGDLFVIFGCGGDRDAKKRPIMGKVASKIADHVIITDDNSRTEDSSKIRKEIIDGMEDDNIKSHIVEIPDRGNAISDTIATKMQKDDILLVAGKGHEDYQIIGSKIIKFSDVEVVKKSLYSVNKL
ncbi:UDP-N-acetylmuramoyl-L-alanyl-D-glutamate--2,6-diaminopimelate ligase, partial [Rickettsiaceae bacterium]|nr:UDP-N-acetylmuramoyl-L-alanyl-D-glutamate--2,6-diaminopimelate ligase [Rickettsiaceae bacterium]